MRRAALCLILAACGRSTAAPDATAPAIDAPAIAIDAPPAIDAPSTIDGEGAAGFGDLSGMCGVLAVGDLTGATPELVRDTLTFERRYNDPADRPLLTPGGQTMIMTPNAGGSSLLSEVFALEQLTRCEGATLLKTETEIVYDTPGKITDFEALIDGHKIGVSVTRAQTFPLGQPYTMDAANTLITRKLGDILVSTADVSAADRWDKQILAILAYDDQAADTMAQAWAALDAQTKADTIVVITTTGGDDTFIYTNM